MLGWELPPYNSGGMGVACYQLCKELARSGADIEFVLPYHAEHNINFMKVRAGIPQDVREVQKAGIAYDSADYVMRDGSIRHLDLHTQAELFEAAVDRIVQLGEYDVIHAHDWLTLRAAMRAKQRTGLPLIVHIHATEFDRSGGRSGNPFVREIEEAGMMLADRIIAVSEYTKNVIMREYGIPADKIEVVHNSIDPEAYEELDAANAYLYLTRMKELGYRVVVNIGRLTIQKGLTNLLQAARQVINQQPKTFFLIVGSGEQLNELVELAADLGIGQNVLFADFQRGKRWRDAYAIADLFVMPSVSEPFGLTPLEAIGYGTPVMVSKQSGVAEVVHHALKVDFWDTNAMADQITAVMQNDCLRDELQKNSYKEYEQLSWQTAAQRFLAIYQKQLKAIPA